MLAWILLIMYFLYVLTKMKETYEILAEEDGNLYRITVDKEGKFVDRKLVK